MRGDDRKRQSTRRAEDRVGRGEYGPAATDEVTLPGDERREAQARDVDDPADAKADTGVWRDGGPTRTPRGMVTTTGGTAGPASVRRTGPPRGRGKVAPTTTGDATTGGMGTPAGGSTSDQSSDASQVGNFTDR
ncbi:hypothetical protein OG792_09340 [Micromonospora sp. NBC_01699]|uniref:hypothetical protein n=1 Tax=Micromonospora sp. NBC_01699 TaxID=2975984 RepID=UPI002E3686CC|nr:hypothetical protein [Micromonospora sp. NBC_01699]